MVAEEQKSRRLISIVVAGQKLQIASRMKEIT
jgi:hypothetical protein